MVILETVPEVIDISDDEKRDFSLGEDVPQSRNQIGGAQMNAHVNIVPPSDLADSQVDDDDVIFIEPPPREVIEIDESVIDTLSERSSPMSSPISKNLATESSELVQNSLECLKESIDNSKDANTLNATESLQSNDFLDSSAIENQHKFNFALHGKDFQLNVPAKNPHYEACGSESSCSTSDVSAPMSVSAFAGSEFHTTNKNLFSDNDLEVFRNYLTKKSDSVPIQSILTLDPKESSTGQRQISRNASENYSSSESEFDGPSTAQVPKVKRALPNLSPMQTQVYSSENNKQNRKRHMGENIEAPNNKKSSVEMVCDYYSLEKNVQGEKRPIEDVDKTFPNKRKSNVQILSKEGISLKCVQLFKDKVTDMSNCPQQQEQVQFENSKVNVKTESKGDTNENVRKV